MKMIHFQISVLRNKQLKSTTIYRKSFFFEAKCVGCSHRIDDPCNVNPRPVIYSRTAVGVRKPPEVFQLRHVILARRKEENTISCRSQYFYQVKLLKC